MKFFLILIGIGALVLMWGVSLYNKLVKKRNLMEEGFSGIDVQLKKRHDLIPNLVNTVKGYATHEQETFQKVMEARSQAMSGMTRDPELAGQAAQSQSALSGALGRLFAVAENYPELKADRNFQQLQQQLSTIESDIEKARRYYNATVRDNNIMVESFPSNIIANMGGFKHGVFFEMEDTSQRETPEVKF